MQRNYNYTPIKNFGSNEYSEASNPLTYCLNDNIDQRLLHGGNSDIYGQYSKPCQAFLSDYCAQKWDGFCELASKNVNISYPNQLQSCSNIGGDTACIGLTAGEILIRNTAAKKYLVAMANCVQRFEPFDPTVPNSPMVSYWIGDNSSYGNQCIPKYAVDPVNIDRDPVMNKILDKPAIALTILINIFKTMRQQNTLQQLNGTRLGRFFASNSFFRNIAL